MRPLSVSADRLNDIGDLAELVANERCPTGKVEPVDIANALGITVSFGFYGDAFDGMLEHMAGRFHIYCNLDRVEDRESPRARFTLGHELGHFYIDEHRVALERGTVPKHPSRCEFESKNPVEIEADQFASNLLMPKSRFYPKAKTVGPGLTGILQLARSFGTSITSTAIRYVGLGISPTAVVKWDNGSFSWKWLSTAVFAAQYRRTIESTAKLPTDSPTARALSGEMPPENEPFFKCGTTAAAWFPAVPMDANNWNVLFMEEAIPLGRFGVLTLLYPVFGSVPASPHL